MKLTRDEAFRQIDQFDEFIHSLVGHVVEIRRTDKTFSLEDKGRPIRAWVQEPEENPYVDEDEL